MTFDQFELWLSKLAESDRKYLDRHAEWSKDHKKAKTAGSLPKGFIERTMELLEGGSESET